MENEKLIEKIKAMSGEERAEHWRNQTLINRTNNENIIGEYRTLIEFIMRNYTERIETIQNPLLHLISHCMELQYKHLIRYFIGKS